jgi:hypothetical protein
MIKAIQQVFFVTITTVTSEFIQFYHWTVLIKDSDLLLSRAIDLKLCKHTLKSLHKTLDWFSLSLIKHIIKCIWLQNIEAVRKLKVNDAYKYGIVHVILSVCI